MNEIQSSNPIIRYLDTHLIDTIKDIKKAEEDTKKEKDNVLKTVFEAHAKIISIIQELL